MECCCQWCARRFHVCPRVRPTPHKALATLTSQPEEHASVAPVLTPAHAKHAQAELMLLFLGNCSTAYLEEEVCVLPDLGFLLKVVVQPREAAVVPGHVLVRAVVKHQLQQVKHPATTRQTAAKSGRVSRPAQETHRANRDRKVHKLRELQKKGNAGLCAV